MVKCSHCELHISVAEAIESKGTYFCSHEHLAADESKE